MDVANSKACPSQELSDVKRVLQTGKFNPCGKNIDKRSSRPGGVRTNSSVTISKRGERMDVVGAKSSNELTGERTDMAMARVALF